MIIANNHHDQIDDDRTLLLCLLMSNDVGLRDDLLCALQCQSTHSMQP